MMKDKLAEQTPKAAGMLWWEALAHATAISNNPNQCIFLQLQRNSERAKKEKY